MGKTATPLKIETLRETLASDDARVITRFFIPGDESRQLAIILRVVDLDDAQVTRLLAAVIEQFGARHRDIESIFEESFAQVRRLVESPDTLSRERRLLIGAYFTMEYSVESAALFNPSIVPTADQSGLPEGSTRFLMSLRAVGEGHISSIVFRRGEINAKGHVYFDPISRYSRRLRVVEDSLYDRETFWLKLIEMGAYSTLADDVLQPLNDQFTLGELEESIERARSNMDAPEALSETAENLLWLARSNYQLQVPADTDPSEIVIFPTSENQSQGIEDARLVRFTENDGSIFYYATYTAYNGRRILPELLETRDFRTIKIHTLNGRYAQNKGLALFPRRVNGNYMMISRLDGENLFLMKSDNIRFWNEAEMIQSPRYPWEFVQIGNCGSPLETDAGWLLLTHGVGPMRQYCIGATLLDLDDPSKIIGQLANPLIVPHGAERDGYVPNVVYTCGAMIHNDLLVIPYAKNDTSTCFATVNLPALLTELT